MRGRPEELVLIERVLDMLAAVDPGLDAPDPNLARVGVLLGAAADLMEGGERSWVTADSHLIRDRVFALLHTAARTTNLILNMHSQKKESFSALHPQVRGMLGPLKVLPRIIVHENEFMQTYAGSGATIRAAGAHTPGLAGDIIRWERATADHLTYRDLPTLRLVAADLTMLTAAAALGYENATKAGTVPPEEGRRASEALRSASLAWANSGKIWPAVADPATSLHGHATQQHSAAITLMETLQKELGSSPASSADLMLNLRAGTEAASRIGTQFQSIAHRMSQQRLLPISARLRMGRIRTYVGDADDADALSAYAPAVKALRRNGLDMARIGLDPEVKQAMNTARIAASATTAAAHAVRATSALRTQQVLPPARARTGAFGLGADPGERAAIETPTRSPKL